MSRLDEIREMCTHYNSDAKVHNELTWGDVSLLLFEIDKLQARDSPDNELQIRLHEYFHEYLKCFKPPDSGETKSGLLKRVAKEAGLEYINYPLAGIEEEDL